MKAMERVIAKVTCNSDEAQHDEVRGDTEGVVAHSPGAVGVWGDATHILVLFLARGQTALSQPLLSQGWLWGLHWEWEWSISLSERSFESHGLVHCASFLLGWLSWNHTCDGTTITY